MECSVGLEAYPEDFRNPPSSLEDDRDAKHDRFPDGMFEELGVCV